MQLSFGSYPASLSLYRPETQSVKMAAGLKGEHLGELEEIILLAVGVLANNKAYGEAIRHFLNKEFERSLSVGAIYATLDRLERKKLITSFVIEPEPIRGGRAKRCLKLSPDGLKALTKVKEDRDKLWQMLQERTEAKS